MPGGLKLGKEAQNKFEEAKVNPDKAGVLEKKGAKRKNWKDRWFVLKDNYLFYCKNDKSNPQGIINLHGCTVSKIEGPTARPNAFSLLAPKSVSIDAKWTNRTYLMAARTSKEMTNWMEKLEENGRKALERAQAKKAEQVTRTGPGLTSSSQAAKSESSDTSDDDTPAAAAPKPVETPKETFKEGPKEPPKETPSGPQHDDEPESQGQKKMVEPEQERDLPASPRSPRIKKEKREKKEKKPKKEKREKKEKKPKKEESSDEEPPRKEVPAVPAQAPAQPEKPVEHKPVEPVKPVEKADDSSDSEKESASRKESSQTDKKFELSDSSEDDKPAQKHKDSDDSDSD